MRWSHRRCISKRFCAKTSRYLLKSRTECLVCLHVFILHHPMAIAMFCSGITSSRFNIVAFPMVCCTGAFRPPIVVVVLSRLLALGALSKSAGKMVTLCRGAADRDRSFCIVLLSTLSSSVSPSSPSSGQGPAEIAHSHFGRGYFLALSYEVCPHILLTEMPDYTTDILKTAAFERRLHPSVGSFWRKWLWHTCDLDSDAERSLCCFFHHCT